MLVEELLENVAFKTREAENLVAPPENAVVHALPDNENADLIFGVTHWKRVRVEELLLCPTSVRFLSREGLIYFLPAIEICILWGLRNFREDEAVCVYDHTESSLKFHAVSKNASQNFNKLSELVDKSKTRDN